MNYDIAFFKPKRFEECLKYIEYIKAQKYVHINLSDVNDSVKRRILDFLNGALFIQEGQILYLGENTICTIPKTGKYFLEYENVELKKEFDTYDEEEEIVPMFSKK